jgi:hypothetical protein
MSPVLADIVAKRFCASERATLIQDQAPTRKVDSKTHATRFDCCGFLLASCSWPTSATKSARIGPTETSAICPLSGANQKTFAQSELYRF